MDPRPLLVRDPRFQDHVSPPGHPERPERLEAIEHALQPLGDQLLDLAPRPATDEEILGAHSQDHLTRLIELEGQDTQLDADTFCSARSLEIARLAAGSSVELALRIARGEARSGFALIRPPGHHAERTHPMGFCLINNVAVSVRALRRSASVERIAIVDWDVHHGNGTQHQFEAERDVLFLSLHQYPFYPGTGALAEQGQDAGEGHTVNLPLPAGCGDAEYGAVFEEIVSPILLEFQPEMLVVSAGFDAHVDDPLGSMQVTRSGFGNFAALLRGVAEETCGGRMLLALEGGYDLDALGGGVATVLGELSRSEVREPEFPAPTPLARHLVQNLRDAHSHCWSSLRRSSSR